MRATGSTGDVAPTYSLGATSWLTHDRAHLRTSRKTDRIAIRDLPQVRIFDNDDLRTPFRQVAVFENGERVKLNEPVPEWLTPLLA